jgi:hypothetical protein
MKGPHRNRGHDDQMEEEGVPWKEVNSIRYLQVCVSWRSLSCVDVVGSPCNIPRGPNVPNRVIFRACQSLVHAYCFFTPCHCTKEDLIQRS